MPMNTSINFQDTPITGYLHAKLYGNFEVQKGSLFTKEFSQELSNKSGVPKDASFKSILQSGCESNPDCALHAIFNTNLN